MARRRGWGRSWTPWGERRAPEPAPRRQELEQTLGRPAAPVRGEGRKLSHTFWGRAWCENLERYHDFANRLPRGRTYLRRGAVLDLAIERGRITALVMGTSLYHVEIEIAAVPDTRWEALRRRCDGKLSSMIELLEGRLGDDVMAAVIEPKHGLFPEPSQIELSCSCPDQATMCKHVAAVLYGVGVRLDEQPRLLFELRGVDPRQMIGAPQSLVGAVASPRRIVDGLSEIFGVDIDSGTTPRSSEEHASHTNANAGVKQASSKKAGAKQASEAQASARKATARPASTKKVGAKRTNASAKQADVGSKAARLIMTRKQLLARGLPASTLQGWLRRRILVPTEEPGVYALTDEARQCLDWYG